MDRFGPEAQRVVESWRLLDQGYEHREFVGSQQLPPIANSEESNCHQLCHSFVPGLPAKTFWDVETFEWVSKLKSKYKEIKKEFTQVTADMKRLEEEGNNIWASALTEDASSYGAGWRTLVLMNRGTWDPINVNLFPKTATAVRDCGVPAAEVFFASMQPQTNIKMHSDFTNFVLTSHLAIDIPDNGSNKCRLTVGDDTRQWINGEVMMFDTSIMHDAINESDKTRYILMIRMWHPLLTEVEQQALQFTFDCLELPELVSPNPDERLEAEYQHKSIKAFPIIKQKPAGAGFGGGGMSSGKFKKTESKQQRVKHS